MIAVQHLTHLLPGLLKPCTIGFFVIYWALVLPFLCWGAWATPGHPHAHPHFVFAVPHLVGETQPDLHSGHTTAASVKPHQATGEGETAGQSLPTILVITLFTLVFASPHPRRLPLRVRRERAPAVLFPSGYPGSVPTPPPRFALV